jgi:hypothetical protein
LLAADQKRSIEDLLKPTVREIIKNINEGNLHPIYIESEITRKNIIVDDKVGV